MRNVRCTSTTEDERDANSLYVRQQCAEQLEIEMSVITSEIKEGMRNTKLQ